MEHDFDYAELGALLIVVGQQMFNCDICAGAAQDGNSDKEMIESLVNMYGIDPYRAQDLVKFPVNDAVNFIQGY